MQIAAGIVILLALLVGVARLLLPEASNFKDEIRAGVEKATGFQIDFALISAGLSLYGPELRLVNTTVLWPDGTDVVTVNEVAVSLDVYSWVTSGRLLPGHIYLEGLEVNVTIAADGELTVQGHPWRDYLPAESQGSLADLPESRLQLADIAFSFKNIQRNGPLIEGIVHRFDARLEDGRVNVSAEFDPGASYGQSLGLEADFPLQLLDSAQDIKADTPWDLRLFAEDFRLNKLLEIAEISDFPVIDSEGDAEFRIAFTGMQPVSLASELQLQRLQLAQPGGTPMTIDSLVGDLDWRLVSGGWQASGERLRIERESRVWPDSEFMIRYSQGPEPQRQQISANATFLRTDDLLPFLQALAPVQLQEAGFTGSVTGDVSDLGLELTLLDQKVEVFKLDAGFANLGYVSFDKGYDISGFSGRIAADNGGGNLEINTRDARFGVAQLFREVLDISLLEGLAIWRAGPQGYRVLADGIRLGTPDGSVSASLELSLDQDLANPVIDLNAEAKLDAVSAAPRYLPKKLPPKVLEWLDVALLGGEIVSADIKMQGPLSKFPYAEGEGVFKIGVNFVEGTLNYAPDWPVMEKASGRLVFDGPSLYSTENKVSVSGIEIRNMNMRIDDLRKGVITIAGSGPLRLENLLTFLQQSPVGGALGAVGPELQVVGAAEASGKLVLPVKDLASWKLGGMVKTAGAEAGLRDIAYRFTDIAGTARIENTQVTADDLRAKLLDEPLSIQVEPVDIPGATISHRARLEGRFPVDKIQAALQLPATKLLNGDMSISAQMLFPGGTRQIEEREAEPAEAKAEFRLLLRSDLEGLASQFPYPLNKTAADTEGLQMELQFPERGNTQIYGTLKRGLSWALEAKNDAAGWRLARGAIMRGVNIPELPVAEGLTLGGEIDSLSLDDWIAVFADSIDSGLGDVPRQEQSPGWQRLFREFDLQIGELTAVGYRFADVDAAVKFGPSEWDIRLAGPWAEGNLLVPYDFEGSQPVKMDMQRLLLIEPQSNGSGDDDTQLSPLRLPALQGRVADFSLGNLRLGTLDAKIRRVPGGLKSELLHTEAASFAADLSYDWLVVDSAQRSRLHLELRSTDVEDTLQKLGYAPLLKAEEGSVTADLLWEGGPGMASLYASTGAIDLSIRDGAVTDVDTGGGRILGLLSLTALPRRLSLDFKDMTEDGLVFDKIQGGFRIDFGDAWTCNLGLEGPVADMGIVGRTGILDEDYDQIAAVRPHVTNLVPVAGFFAGPAVGVATLLVTQLLKKPLSGIGENYYVISGGWDAPQFVEVERSKLDTSRFADCETKLPTLSPEEIRAIEELIANPTLQPVPDAVPPPVSPPADSEAALPLPVEDIAD